MTRSKKPLPSNFNEDVPDLSASEWQEPFAKVKVQRGRQMSQTSQVRITLLLSADVVEYFRTSGLGWQTRIDETLRKAIGLDR